MDEHDGNVTVCESVALKWVEWEVERGKTQREGHRKYTTRDGAARRWTHSPLPVLKPFEMRMTHWEEPVDVTVFPVGETTTRLGAEQNVDRELKRAACMTITMSMGAVRLILSE